MKLYRRAVRMLNKKRERRTRTKLKKFLLRRLPDDALDRRSYWLDLGPEITTYVDCQTTLKEKGKFDNGLSDLADQKEKRIRKSLQREVLDSDPNILDFVSQLLFLDNPHWVARHIRDLAFFVATPLGIAESMNMISQKQALSLFSNAFIVVAVYSVLIDLSKWIFSIRNKDLMKKARESLDKRVDSIVSEIPWMKKD